MSDIFISYSRKNSEQALRLADQLRACGIEVWIDQHGIEAATSWSKEIVEAVEGCKAFLLLLSRDSLSSKNVIRELSIASESERTILPVELESITLPSEFKYQLAGIQRTQISDFDGIIRSLSKLGIGAESSAAAAKLAAEALLQNDATIRIAVLPFGDQSADHDNEWFADGLTDELITTLSNLDQLHVTDSRSSRAYKTINLPLKEIASQLGVRYIVHGVVRKASSALRIQASLVDTLGGSMLWSQKFSGTMEDIFDIQERTAFDIAEGLRIKLSPEQEQRLEERGTENIEAYELYLRGSASAGKGTVEDNLEVLDLMKRAVALDPNYVRAAAGLAVVYANYYRTFRGKTPEILALQRESTERIIALAPESPFTYNARANLHLNLGEGDRAIEAAKMMVRLRPKSADGHGVLGFVYGNLGMFKEATEEFAKALVIEPTMIICHNSLLVSYLQAGNHEGFRRAAPRAFEQFERYLALHPQEQGYRIQYMVYLNEYGSTELADRQIEILLSVPNPYGHTHYQIGWIYAQRGLVDLALHHLRASAERGAFDTADLRASKKDFRVLHELPNFEEIMSELEALQAASAAMASV